ncbi:MAG: RDD family protein [Hymenobacteraceae bacterium]|nr:RDD family protein [Hymenobacteraceae bacterium]MDX5394787.1 RDD family protein [Hymenobacteraceae bacterium]MDX5443782.1 RDD family protein [Hymenobacteraceae bacterium]MDX5510818.1 RDD family protein [Hymenobacteraceae bacterium]
MSFNNTYDPHGTERMSELSGAPLATFKSRFWAFSIDLAVVLILFAFVAWLYLNHLIELKNNAVAISTNFTETNAAFIYSNSSTDLAEIPLPKLLSLFPVKIILVFLSIQVLYFGFTTYHCNGYTLGKKLMKIRVVSVREKKLNLWQSIERAMGYTASILEFGVGFMQYFSNPNHCTVHDRIAETIVIKAKKKKRRKRRSKPEEALRQELNQETKKIGLSRAA